MSIVSRHCAIHGRYYEDAYEDEGCPHCRRGEEHAAAARERSVAAEEQAAEDRQRIQEALNELRSNRDLGEYQCPHCLQRSLKMGASVCPMCQRDVRIDWNAIREDIRQRVAKEATAAAAAAAEWERTRPERERIAEQARLANEHAKEQAERAYTKKRRLDSFFYFLLIAIGIPLMYFLPLFSAWSSGGTGEYFGTMFIPVLNWLIWAGFVLFGHPELLWHALVWLATGIALGFAAHRVVKEVL
jgi:hypothetical protein